MTKCDTRIEDADVNEKDLSIGITFHHLGLIIAAVTGLIAIVLAEYLIFQHALHYLKPWEQKHIIRILFMIPIYAAVSFLSYYFYRHAIYFQVLRDCYEAFAIASFFTLLCNYIATSLHDQKNYFRTTKPKNWIWPLTWVQKCTGGKDKGIFRVPKSGLTWFNIIHVGVFQYCFIRVFFTVVSVLAQATDRYCESSLSPAFAHIWVLVFEGASVTLAMYSLIQFYVQLKPDLAEHKPFLKLLCIKLVIFFSFWQNLVISFLSSGSGPLKPTEKLSWPDIKVGIPSVLLTCEMAIFATLHLFAFPWRKPYGRPSKFSTEHELFSAPGSTNSDGSKPHYQGGPLGMKAFLDAFNPWDIVKASARGFRWLFVGVRRRHHDISYQQTHDGGGGSDSFRGPYSQPVGGGGGAAMYGYAPSGSANSQNYPYDSTKLQPIASGSGIGYPLSESLSTSYIPAGPGATNTTYDGNGDGEQRVGRWNRSARGKDDDPWATTDPRFTPSPSPSPAPPAPGQYQYTYGSERDNAGLLKYGAQPAVTGNTDSAPRRAAAPTYAESDDDDNYDGDDDDNDGNGYGGYQRVGGGIGVAQTTDDNAPGGRRGHDATSSGGQGLPAFHKEAELEQQYRGYGRSSWGHGGQQQGRDYYDQR